MSKKCMCLKPKEIFELLCGFYPHKVSCNCRPVVIFSFLPLTIFLATWLSIFRRTLVTLGHTLYHMVSYNRHSDTAVNY